MNNLRKAASDFTEYAARHHWAVNTDMATHVNAIIEALTSEPDWRTLVREYRDAKHDYGEGSTARFDNAESALFAALENEDG